MKIEIRSLGMNRHAFITVDAHKSYISLFRSQICFYLTLAPFTNLFLRTQESRK